MSDLGSENKLMDLIDDCDEQAIDPEIVLQQMLENPDLQQHMTRMVHEGREHVTAYFRVPFEPGRLRAIVHVPFSPPMRSVPQTEAHVTEHDGIRVRITDCQKFGLRAEIIRSSLSDTGEKVLVEFIAMEQ